MSSVAPRRQRRMSSMNTELSFQILVNGLELAHPRTELDRFWLGKNIADVFEHRFKIAALVQTELITNATENTAVNRVARFFVTDDEELALRWLVE